MTLSDIEFLKRFFSELQSYYQIAQGLSQSDISPSENTSTDEERCARIADDYGFDGNLFRNLYREERLSIIEKSLKKRIETIPRIIAAIEHYSTKKQLSENDLSILFFLKSQQRPIKQAEIVAGTDLSRRTIGKCLEMLRKERLVYRPNGERKGESITEAGSRQIQDIEPPAH